MKPAIIEPAVFVRMEDYDGSHIAESDKEISES